jgi:hypothetical protein
MGKFGKAALNAVALLKNGQAGDPQDAWEKVTAAIFGRGTSSQKKSCPKDAFLGLCDAGLIKGVSSQNSTTSVDNKAYAVAGAQLLKSNPGLSALGAAHIWARVMRQVRKPVGETHNQQMDVVKSLFDYGLI